MINPDKSLGMTFCHPGNFLASTETLEQAINVANIAVDMNKEADGQKNDLGNCEETYDFGECEKVEVEEDYNL